MISKIGRDALFPLKHTELIFDHHNFYEMYKDLLDTTSDVVSVCDAFNQLVLGMIVLKCFDHFGSQAEDDCTQYSESSNS